MESDDYFIIKVDLKRLLSEVLEIFVPVVVKDLEEVKRDLK